MGWNNKGKGKGHGAKGGAGKGNNNQGGSWWKWPWTNSSQAAASGSAASDSGKRPAVSDSAESGKGPAGEGEWFEIMHEGRPVWVQADPSKGVSKGQSSSGASASSATAAAVDGKRQKVDNENKLDKNQDGASAKSEEYSEAVLAAATSAKVTLPTANQANVELANAAMRGTIEWQSFEHLEEPSYWLGKTSLSMGAANGCYNLIMTTFAYVFAGFGQLPLMKTLQNPKRTFEWGMGEYFALCHQAYSNFGEAFSDVVQGWTSKMELVKSLFQHLSADAYEHGKARASINRLIGWCAPYTRLVRLASWPGGNFNAFAAVYVSPLMETVLLGLPLTGVVKIFYTLSANFPGNVDVQQYRDFLLGAQQVFGLRMGGAAELDTGIIQTLLGSSHAKGESKSKLNLVLRHVCQTLSKVDEDLSADGDAVKISNEKARILYATPLCKKLMVAWDTDNCKEVRANLWPDCKTRRCSQWSTERLENAYLKIDTALTISSGEEFETSLLLQGNATLAKEDMEAFLKFKEQQAKGNTGAGSSKDGEKDA